MAQELREPLTLDVGVRAYVRRMARACDGLPLETFMAYLDAVVAAGTAR